MIGGISFSATTITSGLDADKPVNPRPGNQYLATDTKKQYNCYVASIWTDNSRVSSGASAEIPSNPVVGDIFINTQDKNIYYYFSAGLWGPISSINNMEIVGVYNTTKLAASNDANQTLAYLWYEKKVIYVPTVITKAQIRISWEAGYDGQGRDIESLISINGVDRPIRYTANDWTAYHEDATVYGGDKISLWAHYTDNLNTGGNVRNFRIYTELKYRHTLKSLAAETGWVFDVDNV